MLAEVRADAAAGRFSSWGGSTLIDEFTGVPSIPRELFDALHEAAGIRATFPVGNAGLLHVYGYWFSRVRTPFGYKRDRWLQGDLARALGCAGQEFLLGTTESGTTLARVTRAALPVLLDPPAGATVAEAEFGSPSGPRVARVVLHAAEPGGPTALVYGIGDGVSRGDGPTPVGVTAGEGDDREGRRDPAAQRPLRLITAFPVSGDPAGVLADFARAPGARWNAVADW